MKRREFLTVTTAALLVPQLAVAAGKTLDYKPGLVQQRLDAGETVFVDFSAAWCSTCRAQERAITALRAENAAYDEAITFVKVDWDTYRQADLTKALKIPRRSTLVLLRGDAELGRIVARTSKGDIQALLDLAV